MPPYLVDFCNATLAWLDLGLAATSFRLTDSKLYWWRIQLHLSH